jgi:hypothetical protein
MTSVSPPASSVVDTEKTAQDAGRSSEEDTNQGSQSPNGEKQIEGDVEQGEPVKPQGTLAAFDPRENLDGGVKEWLCLLGGFCTLFCRCVLCMQTTLKSLYSNSYVALGSSARRFFQSDPLPVAN